jgi:hypothetical protein
MIQPDKRGPTGCEHEIIEPIYKYKRSRYREECKGWKEDFRHQISTFGLE